MHPSADVVYVSRVPKRSAAQALKLGSALCLGAQFPVPIAAPPYAFSRSSESASCGPMILKLFHKAIRSFESQPLGSAIRELNLACPRPPAGVVVRFTTDDDTDGGCCGHI